MGEHRLSRISGRGDDIRNNLMTKRKPPRKDEAVYVRIAPAELKTLQLAAKAADRDWPDWVRRTLKQAAAKGKP